MKSLENNLNHPLLQAIMKANTGTSSQQFVGPDNRPRTEPQKISEMIGAHEIKVKWLGGDRNDAKSYAGFKDDAEKYTYIRPASGHMGKYQVSPGMLETYSKGLFGRKIDPIEFLKTPELQDKFVNGIIGRWQAENMGDKEIIQRWNQGRNKELKDNKDAEEYYRKVTKGL